MLLFLFVAVVAATPIWTDLFLEREFGIAELGEGAATIGLSLLAFQILLGDASDPVYQAWWWLLAGVAGVATLFRFVYQPLVRKKLYRVVGVERESEKVWTIRLEPKGGRGIGEHLPGQFAFHHIRRFDGRSEEHPFTIASSPTADGESLEISVKKSGDFTDAIDETKVDDTVKIDGPFGRFSFMIHDPKKILFIIGGIGITPAMSMLRALRDRGDSRPVLLLYANVDEGAIAFRDELEAMPDSVEVVHVLSDPSDDWTGRRGFIDAELLEEAASGFLGGAEVYLCGPLLMMDMVGEALDGLGVARMRVHSERFSL